MDTTRRRFAGALAASPLVGIGARAAAQGEVGNWPAHQLRLVIPFQPGGGTDVVGRTIAQKLSARWGQSVVVENRAGGNGTIGLDSVAKAAGDGYSLTMVTASLSVNVTLQGHQQPYNLLKDFAPISQLTRQPYVLVVNPTLPVHSVQDLIALAKSRTDKPLTYGSSGVGGLSHLSGALLAQKTGTTMTHVPYKGGQPALIDLIGGQIDFVFATRLEASAALSGNQVRPLAVSTATRSAASPDLPTVAEAGVPGYEVGGWYGMLAPVATPAPIVAKIHDAVVAVIREQDVLERMATDGSEAVGSDSAAFAEHMRREVERWRKLITELRIPTE